MCTKVEHGKGGMTRFWGVVATAGGTLLSVVTVSLEVVLPFAVQSPTL